MAVNTVIVISCAVRADSSNSIGVSITVARRMTFQEKLRLAAQNVNKALRGREQGLKENTISSYIATGSIPRAGIALKIARAVGVPLEWLVDDAQDFPPPKQPPSGLSAASDRDVIIEAAMRYGRAIIDHLKALKAADKIDWAAAAEQLEKLRPDEPLPENLEVARYAKEAVQISFMRMRNDYDIDMLLALEHASIADNDPLKFIAQAKDAEFFHAFKVREDVSRFERLLAARPDHPAGGGEQEVRRYDELVNRYYSTFEKAGFETPRLAGARLAEELKAKEEQKKKK